MKRSAFQWLCLAWFAAATLQTHGQETGEKKVSAREEVGEDGPIMYKFEPDYLLSVADRKERIRVTRSVLDTLDISEGKRRRLLKELYKNGVTERLTKAMLANSNFEEVDH